MRPPLSVASRLLVLVALIVGAYFFADRVACLFWTPPKSSISGWDNGFYFYWLRSPVIDGDFDFRNDLQDAPTLPPDLTQFALRQPATPTGLLPNKYGIGWALSTAPFYLATDLGVRLWNAVGGQVPRDGYGPPYQWAVQLGQLCWALVGLSFAYALLRRWYDANLSLQALLLVWLTSFLFYYQTTLLTMAHSVTFGALAACYWCTLRAGEEPMRWRWWLALGACGGLAVISRFQTAVYLLYPAVVALTLLRREPRCAGRVVSGALAGAAVIGLQLAAWKTVYGSWLVYSYSGEAFHWGQPELWAVLFSPFHGLFYWSPALLPAALAFAFAPALRAGGRWTWPVVFLLCIYVNAAWSCWWFGMSFGSRAFEGCLLFCMFGLAELLRAVRSRPALAGLVGATAALLIGWNVALGWGARKNRIPMEEPVTYPQMLRLLLTPPAK
ncbi:MAG: glycosyltransferase family 39 protein [Verrucomicrobia bacterium]|nr:glycosyltransferase family 39 protein [Verrucomicrobiota bacterium]